MATETPTQSYSEKWYWDDRYTNESEPFDWYQKYPSLAPLVNLYVPQRNHRVLVVGCGNSAFSEGMVDDGYEDVVSIDISSVVIDTMLQKYYDRPQLKYLKMDVRDMKAFEDASFDAVIDKGTLDSILCGSNSRQYSTQMLEELMKIFRVLKNKGVYILITYGAPNYHLRLLDESCSWETKLHVIEVKSLEKKAKNVCTKAQVFEQNCGWDGNKTCIKGFNKIKKYPFSCECSIYDVANSRRLCKCKFPTSPC